jgi:DNA-binding MarR family transcriptional regulator
MRAARDCTMASVRRAARALSSLYDEALATTGLRGTQFSLLVAVSVAGEIPVSRMASVLGLDRTTLTRNLGPLQDGGLLETVAADDRRVRLVRLTAKGRGALERALPLWDKAQRHVVRSLGEPRWRKLVDELAAVAAIAGPRE